MPNPGVFVGAVTEGLEVRECFFGAMFLATGTLAKAWSAALENAVAANGASREKAPDPSIERRALAWPSLLME